MAEESKDLVPSRNVSGELMKMGGNERGNEFLTTLDPADKNYRRNVFQLIQRDGENIRGYFNKEIKIVSFVAFPCEMEDEQSGELINTVLIKMLLSDGKMIQTHSNAVRKRLALACDVFGLPSTKTPFVCTPISRPLRDGKKSMIQLEFPS